MTVAQTERAKALLTRLVNVVGHVAEDLANRPVGNDWTPWEREMQQEARELWAEIKGTGHDQR